MILFDFEMFRTLLNIHNAGAIGNGFEIEFTSKCIILIKLFNLRYILNKPCVFL